MISGGAGDDELTGQLVTIS
ncbi:MAG: hypothetical protein R3F38_02915 [Gammaproteobacteria bacterium]